MESCEDFFQLRQAIPKHSTLKIIVSAMARRPKLPKNIKAAGINTSATMRNATVVVYPVPVDFWLVSKMATSLVVGVPKNSGEISSPDLAQTICEWAGVLKH